METTELHLDEAVAVLERTPATLRSLLEGLPDAWTGAIEGPDTWSPRDVLAHLTDLEETDWMPRARRILEHGTSLAFEPVARERFRTSLAGLSIGDLLLIFADRRSKNLDDLKRLGLGDVALLKRGVHPDPSFGEVTLGQLIATWAVHDLTHVAQVVRVMAKRYEGTVGPWRAYLGVLNR